MCFNSVGSLLAVSSAHDTIHIFKLSGKKGSSASSSSSGSTNGNGKDGGLISPSESVDGAEELEGGYEEFVKKKTSTS